ncbi:MAG: NAD(P)/FAD-dependent oxidoreductase [Firmicutes bacterium]|nr:NAD(P)/FAD-dependent oxidoreductase [Bacillota bacterium]
MYDVIIIGAGVSGCAAARYLSAYDAKVCVIERAEDVCCGTSKANSAIVHAGFDAVPGSLMAKYNVEGSLMMEQLCKDLDIPYKRCGSLVVRTESDPHEGLEELLERGIKNGVRGLELIGRERLKEMEPNISDEAAEALWAPTGAIICPFELTIALAENAAENGAEFRFDTEVTGIEPLKATKCCADGNCGGWLVHTDKGDLEALTVINAAGVYADKFHNMVSEKKLHITPRRGDYYLLDREVGNHVTHTIFQLPDEMGKGVLVSQTVHGNIIVGPTAFNIEDKEGVNTTAEGLAAINQKAGKCVKDIPLNQTITSFAGLRAQEDGKDFVIGEPEDASGFYDCAGIASPGLSSAPAIGKALAEMIAERLKLEAKADFKATRKGILKPSELSFEERSELIKKDHAYGQIICRCETVTEGEIVDAIRRPLGAKSLDGVKRRTRAGMGRCQAGFCSPKVMEILARELGVPMSRITKSGGNSKLILEDIKEGLSEDSAGLKSIADWATAREKASEGGNAGKEAK